MTPPPGTPLPHRKTLRRESRGVPTGRRKPYQEGTAMSQPIPEPAPREVLVDYFGVDGEPGTGLGTPSTPEEVARLITVMPAGASVVVWALP